MSIVATDGENANPYQGWNLEKALTEATVRGEDLTDLLVLDEFELNDGPPYQWQALWDSMTEALTSLGLAEIESEPEEKPAYDPTRTAHLAGTRFNETADHALLLKEWGRCKFRRSDTNTETWHYINAANDGSVTFYKQDRHITVYSETMAAELRLDIGRPYDLFGFWAFTKHKGDFTLANADLKANGIGNLQRPANSNGKSLAKAARPLIVVTGTDVQKVRLGRLWKDWLLRRKLHMLDGDPDVGKSTLSLDIVARVTTGAAMPDGSPGIEGGGDVVLLSNEDDIDDTTAWRLDIAGADQSRVHHVIAAQDQDGEAPITIPQDLESLETVIRDTGAVFVVVDVLAAYLDGSVDTYNDAKVRRVLYQMRQIASRTGVSILMLRHLRKSGGEKAVYVGGGSIGIIGAARGGWIVVRDKNDPSLRILASQKMNLGQEPKSLSFRLIPYEHDTDYAYVRWEGPVEVRANQLMEPTPPRPTEDEADNKTRIEQCEEALINILSEPGDHWSNDVLEALEPLKFNGKTIDAARARAKIETRFRKRPDGTMGHLMYLPGTAPPKAGERSGDR